MKEYLALSKEQRIQRRKELIKKYPDATGLIWTWEREAEFARTVAATHPDTREWHARNKERLRKKREDADELARRGEERDGKDPADSHYPPRPARFSRSPPAPSPARSRSRSKGRREPPEPTPEQQQLEQPAPVRPGSAPARASSREVLPGFFSSRSSGPRSPGQGVRHGNDGPRARSFASGDGSALQTPADRRCQAFGPAPPGGTRRVLARALDSSGSGAAAAAGTGARWGRPSWGSLVDRASTNALRHFRAPPARVGSWALRFASTSPGAAATRGAARGSDVGLEPPGAGASSSSASASSPRASPLPGPFGGPVTYERRPDGTVVTVEEVD